MAEESKSTRSSQSESGTDDPIQRYANQLLAYAKSHTRQLIAAGAVVCAVVVVAVGVMYFLENAENQASALLIRATEQHENLDAEADDAAVSGVKQAYERLIDQYGYTDAGKMALLPYAGLCYRTADYDRALALYQEARKAFGDNPRFSPLAVNGMAYAHAAKGEFERAIALFEQLVEDPSPVLKPQALFQLGLLYDRTGAPEKSRQAYERLVSDFPDSVFAEPAKARLSG